jgi:Na+-translocating ferredoxin:NAD+ oxidoreductase RnfD subunit
MENKSSAESRFRFYQYFFYVGGVPLFYSILSHFYRVYSFLCYVCFYTTIIAMFMDIYHHLDDMDHILDTAMLFTVFMCESYTLMYFR